jgi:hypothetical protein
MLIVDFQQQQVVWNKANNFYKMVNLYKWYNIHRDNKQKPCVFFFFVKSLIYVLNVA